MANPTTTQTTYVKKNIKIKKVAQIDCVSESTRVGEVRINY